LFRPAVLAVFAAILVVSPRLQAADEKVAEGDYQLTNTSPEGDERNTTIDHWTLFALKSGGFRLEAEVTAATGTGVRVRQTEVLNEHLVPVSLTIRMYTTEDKKAKAFSSVQCHIANQRLGCRGLGDEEGTSPEIELNGPFLFALPNPDSTDFAWSLANIINLAHLEGDESQANVPTLVFQESESEGMELAQTDSDVLHFVGSETLKYKGSDVTTRHYRFENNHMDCWTTTSGLLLQMQSPDGMRVELQNFKQFKKVFPDLP